MELSIDEVLGYLGAGQSDSQQLRQDVRDVAEELTAALRPRFVYRVFPLAVTTEGFRLEVANVCLRGKSAEIMLKDCHQAALLCCTLGAVFDAMLRTCQARNLAKAVILDACGSAWVEAGCHQAEQELAARLPELFLTDRFSPGYGDLPLSLQPELCGALDVQRRLGVCVTEQYLLTPCKSVTAVIGISNKPQQARIRGCQYCAMQTTCKLRKEGNRCEC